MIELECERFIFDTFYRNRIDDIAYPYASPTIHV